MILAAILFLLSAIGSAWPELFIGMPGSGDHTFMYAFVAYRILGGIGVGLASMVSPMYIAEVAPADRRGNLVAWNQFAIIFGMLVVYFVNYTIALQGDAAWLNTIGWRWMFASEIIPAVLFLSFLMFVPETPRYLVMRGRTEKALGVLSHLMDQADAGRELEDIRNSFKEKAPVDEALLPVYGGLGWRCSWPATGCCRGQVIRMRWRSPCWLVSVSPCCSRSGRLAC